MSTKDKKIKVIILIITFIVINLHGSEAQKLAKEFQLYAGTKASIQWERIFSSQRHLKKYKLNSLSELELHQLKKYLIQHAADSDHPIVPGL